MKEKDINTVIELTEKSYRDFENKSKALQLVTFSQAELLKKLGFDYPTYEIYEDEKLHRSLSMFNHNCLDKGFNIYSAPTVQLVFLWLSNERKIHVSLITNRCGYKKWTIKGRGILSREGDVIDNAESEALNKALQLLEESL